LYSISGFALAQGLSNTTALTSAPNPSMAGQAVTLTAVVTAGSEVVVLPAGTVTFSDGDTALGTANLTNFTASFTVSTLAAGSHSLSARYSGDANYTPSTGTTTHVVQAAAKTPTSTSFTPAPNPSAVGQTVNLTATVTPAAATGSVTFLDGTASLGTASLSGGSATLAVGSLGAGSHSLSAAYGGSSSYDASASAAVTQAVNKASTSTALAASPNPATLGQAVTLTATVTPAAATGTVTFLNGTANLGSAALANGTAAITTSALPAGSNVITAVYGGDANYLAGTSAAVTEVVNAVTPSPVAVTLVSNPAGQSFSVSGSGCAPGTYTAPATPSWTPGSNCTVTFVSPAYPQVGTKYTFGAWRDGPTSNPRTIAAPAQATTYTADFTTQFFLTTAANPAGGGAVSGGGWYDANSTATVTATPAGGYRFQSWSGAAGGSDKSATVTMSAAQTVTANFGPSIPTPPSSYAVTQIFGAGTKADAINNYGQVAAHTTAEPSRGLLWTPGAANALTGSLTDLGSLSATNGTPSVVPSGINSRGQVVGTVTVLPGSTTQAFLWQPAAANTTSGSMVGFLGSAGASGSTAAGINSLGQIIGVNGSSGFLWTPLSPNGINGSVFTDSRLNYPQAVNDFGQVTVSGTSLLFTPSSANGAGGVFTVIPNPGGAFTRLSAINTSGTVLGSSYTMHGETTSGFIWTPSSPNGTAGTSSALFIPTGFYCVAPVALNAGGQIAGTVSVAGMGTAACGSPAPFLYSGGVFYDLSTLPNWPGGTPAGLNDQGQIVVNNNGLVYLLTPQVPPAPAAASPQSGTGFGQAMTFTFADPRGWQDLDVVNVLINNFIDGRAACYLAYSVPSSTLYLVNDDGRAGGPFAGSVALGNAVTIENSQCAVRLISAAGSGTTLTLGLDLLFKPAFAGNKIMYLAARDALQASSGWLPLGVWRVPGGTPTVTTSVVGMSPARGTGTGPAAFTFNFADSVGNPDLGVANILVASALDGRHACYIAYSRPYNVLYLVSDAGDALLPGKSLAAPGTLENSQCGVSWGNSPVLASGQTVALSVNLGFAAGFGPNLVFYLAVRDVREGNNTGWQATGTWTVR
jgi:hypothetical protein